MTSPQAPPERSRIELFSPAALERAAGPPPGPGGHLRRAGDGLGDPRARDPERDAARVKESLRAWAREEQGRRDVAAGRVDPVWREVERQVAASFRPDAAEISDDSRLAGAARQLVRALGTAPTSGPISRADDLTSPAAELDFAAAQIAAAKRSLSQPGGWLRAELEVRVDRDGRVLEVRLLSRTGRAALDRQALDAIRRAVAARALRDPRGPVLVRFAVDAAVRVTPPSITPRVNPAGGQALTPVLDLLTVHFDANFKPVGLDHALRRHVYTHVELLSIVPDDAPPERAAVH